MTALLTLALFLATIAAPIAITYAATSYMLRGRPLSAARYEYLLRWRRESGYVLAFLGIVAGVVAFAGLVTWVAFV